MAQRLGGRRKPVLTVRPADAGEALGEVAVKEIPCTFGSVAKGSSRTWLQYVHDDLSMVHRTYYLAELDWSGRTVHQIETEYYEPEFPEARLWMQWWVEEAGEHWRTVMWGQRYPNATAELNAADIVTPRVLRPGQTEPWEVEVQTYRLDSCGRFQAPCLRCWDGGGDGVREYFLDGQGLCLLGRWWKRGEPKEEGEPVLERAGQRYTLLYDQIPSRLVYV